MTTQFKTERKPTPKVRVKILTLGVFYMEEYDSKFKLKVVKNYLKRALGYKKSQQNLNGNNQGYIPSKRTKISPSKKRVKSIEQLKIKKK